MQRNTYLSRHYDEEEEIPSKHDNSNCTCDECGEMFQKPLLATVMSNDSSQKYYACPRCLTKVSEVKAQQKEESKDEPLKRYPSQVGTGSESVGKCQHFLGYLKKRPKDVSIPDQCLTCPKMVECLYLQ
jgi:DNA-directed RNA polymerase subunit RPC12/RpoP